jgi:hypothetical protein
VVSYWRKVFSVALLLAWSICQVEVAHHIEEHHDATHSEDTCVVCAFAQQHAITTGVESPSLTMDAVSEPISPESPILTPSPCHFTFRPRSPPCSCHVTVGRTAISLPHFLVSEGVNSQRWFRCSLDLHGC